MSQHIPTNLDFPKSFEFVDNEFSDKTADDIKEWSISSGDLFLRSDAAHLLLQAQEIDESDIAMAISCFAEMCYGHHLQKPGQWTSATVKDVCLNLIPRKVLCGDEFFKYLAKVIAAFISWVDQNSSVIKNGKTLINCLKKHEYEILKNSRTSSNWGVGKSILKDVVSERTKRSLADNDADLSIADSLQSVRFYDNFFPKEVLNKARAFKDEAKPVLRSFIMEAIESINDLDEDDVGFLYAFYLLSEFRDTSIFPLIMRIASLPEDKIDILLGDMLTETLHQFIASTYNGNIQVIKDLIENPAACIWARDAGLRSLLVLVNHKDIKREWVIDYFSELLGNQEISAHPKMMAFIAGLACDIYAEKLFEKLKIAFEEDRIDKGYINWKSVEETIENGMNLTLERELKSPQYSMIENAIEEMGRWHMFREISIRSDKVDCSSFHDFESLPYERTEQKIGRNDPCPCGSGKKFKKCCLM